MEPTALVAIMPALGPRLDPTGPLHADMEMPVLRQGNHPPMNQPATVEALEQLLNDIRKANEPTDHGHYLRWPGHDADILCLLERTATILLDHARQEPDES